MSITQNSLKEPGSVHSAAKSFKATLVIYDIGFESRVREDFLHRETEAEND